MPADDRSDVAAVAPDSRTIQANERTLLAWLRTGISLITFGFVIARLGVWVRVAAERGAEIPGVGLIGGLFVLLGAVMGAIGIARYVQFHRALISGRTFPFTMTPVLVAALAVAGLGAILGAFVLVSLLL